MRNTKYSEVTLDENKNPILHNQPVYEKDNTEASSIIIDNSIDNIKKTKIYDIGEIKEKKLLFQLQTMRNLPNPFFQTTSQQTKASNRIQ